jgi:2-methylisocitrate lyase-like PEP mutase family enzyme
MTVSWRQGAAERWREQMGKMTTALKEAIAAGGIIAPSCFDPFSVRLAEVAGFRAAHLTGLGVEATLLGSPDVGLLSMSELVEHVARITAAVDIPLLADVDTGFGSVLNVQRTIREIQRAGAAGIHIEDQALPKHCPVLPTRKVVSREAALDRLKAALDARTDPDFVIVARTDADIVSMDEVIERCNLFLEAGADMVMPLYSVVDGTPYSALAPDEQMAVIRRLTAGIAGPVMNMGGRPPKGYNAHDLLDAGFRLVIFGCALPAAANAMAAGFRELLETGNCTELIDSLPGPYWDTLRLLQDVGLDEHVKAELRYSTAGS